MFSVEFLITSLIVVLLPGTGVVFTVSAALTQGLRGSFYASLGCTLGIVPHLLATIFGLAAVLHTSALLFQILKYAGVAYLFYLAVMTWRDRQAFAIDASAAPVHRRELVVAAILLNFFNPKLTLFFLAFLPQFVTPQHGSTLAQLLGLSAVFMALTFAVFLACGWLAHGFRRWVVESPRVQAWLRRGLAAAFAGLGWQLATTER